MKVSYYKNIKLFLCLCYFFITISSLSAQSWYNHTELNWQTIETEHFYIHFHDETIRSGREAAAVAEQIYEPVTSFYDFEPDTKTHIIIQDTDDASNGMAYYYDNKIIIWALPLDFDLRGSHRWLNNVITHEFTHIIQIGAAMKFSRRYPASFVQLMGYEDEKREDVLYGYPNVLMSYPIPGVSVPPWLAEGTAQFMYPGADFDFWDSHRDMIVRDRILNNNLLSFDAMNAFGKRGIGNESTYNQGFLFSSWLSKKYGNTVLKDITYSLSKPFNYSINSTLKSVTGKTGYELYENWKKELLLDYSNKTKFSEKHGNILISEGTTNIHPVWSPAGDKFAYLSNKQNDYFGQTDLFIYNFEDAGSEKIAGGIQTAPSWVNDSTIIYTKKSLPNKFGSRYFDIYRYNFIEEEEKRLTYNSRFISPVYDRNSNSIIAINSYDGTSNLMIAKNINFEADTIKFVPLTDFNNGIQILSIAWFEDQLFFDGVYHQGRQVYKVDLLNGEAEMITEGKWENRDQEINSFGFVFASDKSGISNLFLDRDGVKQYITNVKGGAFMPSISNDGKILYSLYNNGKYNIALIENIKLIDEKNVGYEENYFLNFPLSDLILDENLPYNTYQENMLSLAIMPKLMVDYKSFKPGFYFYGNEVLDRFSLFGGASVNILNDLDIFLIMEYRKFIPTLYTNLFWITRHRKADRSNPMLYPRVNKTEVDNIEILNDLAFNLFSGDIGTRFKLGLAKIHLQYNYSNYRQNVKQHVSQYFTYNDIDSTIWQAAEIGFDYYRGHSLSLIYDIDMRKPSYAMNMLPGNGWKLNTKISYEWNQFMDGFTVSEEYSTFGANFMPHNTGRVTAEIEKHFTINKEKKIVSSLHTIGGLITNSKIDDFFYFFAGGLPGLKGYTFYDEELTGPNYVIGTASIRFPLFLEKNLTFAQFNMQNFSIGGILQFGSASENTLSDFFAYKDYKLSSGIEFRFQGYSFYSYPSAISYEFHKPVSDFDEKGKHYFTFLFDF